MLESLFVPTLIVALAEIGDKTQLLALLLAARFRRPWPIIWGMVAATLANHLAAGAVGNWVAGLLSPALLSWILAALKLSRHQADTSCVVAAFHIVISLSWPADTAA